MAGSTVSLAAWPGRWALQHLLPHRGAVLTLLLLAGLVINVGRIAFTVPSLHVEPQLGDPLSGNVGQDALALGLGSGSQYGRAEAGATWHHTTVQRPTRGLLQSAGADVPDNSTARVFGGFNGTLLEVKECSPGWTHLLVLSTDGTIRGFGTNGFNETTPPSYVANSRIESVKAGGNYSLALSRNGTVSAWGRPDLNVTLVPSSIQGNVVAISAGYEHALALLESGEVVAWGSNRTNQTLVPAVAKRNVAAIAAGGYHSLALLESGRVVAWGDDSMNQTAVPDEAQGNVLAIAAGGFHSLALLAGGQVIAWGSDADGATTVPAGATAGVTQIAAGWRHSLALDGQSGSLLAWGSNSLNQTQIPEEVMLGVAAISAGYWTSVAFVPSAADPPPPPAPLPPPPNPPPPPSAPPPIPLTEPGLVEAYGQFGGRLVYTQAVAAGYDHILSLSLSGVVSGFGSTNGPWLTIPSITYNNTVAVAAGYKFSAALLANGSVIIFGGNSSQTTIPTGAQSGVKALSAGEQHIMALREDGQVLVWGDSSRGQMQLPESVSTGVTAIAAGGYHCVALLESGAVVVWGDDSQGQVSRQPAAARRNVTAIAAGGHHTLALTRQGRVLGWGTTRDDVAAVPSSAFSNATSIAAGWQHSLALVNGTVVAWGSNSQGQISIRDPSAPITKLSAGYWTSFLFEGQDGAGGGGAARPPPGGAGFAPPPIPSNAVVVESTDSKSFPTAAVAGAAAGGAVGVALLVAIITLMFTRKRRRQRSLPTYLGGTPDVQPSSPPLPPPLSPPPLPYNNNNNSNNNNNNSSSEDGVASMSMMNRGQGYNSYGGAGRSAPKNGGGGTWAGSMTRQPAPPTAQYGVGGALAPQVATETFAASPVTSPVAAAAATAAGLQHYGRSPVGSAGGSAYSPPLDASNPQDPPSSGSLSTPYSLPAAAVSTQVPRISMADMAVGEVMGEGRLGKVFKGKWAGNTVAVKMLDLDDMPPGAKSGLHAATMATCQLHHPNVARMFGVVDEGPYQALVMQHYRRGSLARALASLWFSDLKQAQRLKLAMQVAAGMSFLHSRRPPIVHGALKLSNLLVEDDGQRVVIADTGMATRIPVGTGHSSPELDAATASVTPPELFDDPYALPTPAADVYAFGVTLLEIMQCQPAFFRLQEPDIRYMVMQGMRPSIPERVQPGVRDLIRECWAQDPAERPSFERVVTSIDALLAAGGSKPRSGSLSRSGGLPPSLVV